MDSSSFAAGKTNAATSGSIAHPRGELRRSSEGAMLETMAQATPPDQHNSPIAGAFRRLRDHPSRKLRMVAGVSLVIGGILGILPVLGFWMLPLGLLLLSVDVPWVRRGRRRLAVWWGRKTGRPSGGASGRTP